MLRAPLSLLVLCLTGVVAAGAPQGARAATCSDYPNQAAAQRAANTRDADGDGVYCESLPCPCLGAGHAAPSPSPSPGTRRRRHRRLGRTIPFGPVRRRSGCRVRGPLPDPDCTPGTRFALVTKRDVCTPGYAGRVRNVRETTRDAVYAAYGVRTRFDGRDGELDHLVSLELGGTNARANLFPQTAAGRDGSAEKDRLENALHDDVCAGRMRLRDAQRRIARDWVAEYRSLFG